MRVFKFKLLRIGLAVLGVFADGLSCGVADAAGDSTKIPSITLPLAETPPVIDGVLDDPAWDAALVVNEFFVITQDDALVGTNVTAKLIRDAEWLYVGFDIRHPAPGRIQPKVTRRDDKVQWEDCVKVAFDPGTDGALWYHLRLSAGNVQSDQRNFRDRSNELSWDMPWRSATRLTEYGWQAELALPLSCLLDRGNPERARINLLVYSYVPVIDPYGVEIGLEREALSLAAVAADWWNHTESFVPLTGLNADTVRAAFLPVLGQPALTEYLLIDGEYVYDVSLEVANSSSRDGKVRVAVIDQPVGGEALTRTRGLDVPADATVQATFRMPAANLNSRSLTVELRTQADEVIEVREMNPDALNVFAGYLDRNYYTSEPEAYALCRISLSAETLRDMRLTAIASDGGVLGLAEEITPTMRLPVALSKLPEGDNLVTLALQNRHDGQTVAEQKLTLIKRAPAPEKEWKLDMEHATVLRDDQPFFAYGLLIQAGSINEQILEDIKAAGFNVLLYWASKILPEQVRPKLDLVGKHGLYMGVRCEGLYELADIAVSDDWLQRMGWSRENFLLQGGLTGIKGRLCGMGNVPRLERNNLFNEAYQAVRPAIREALVALRDHPALMFWEGFDEPQPAHFDQHEQGMDLYKMVYELDGYRPLRVLWNSGLPPWDEKFTAWSDFHARDPYWTPPDRGPEWVAEQVMQLAERSAVDHKPIWITPVFERWSGNHKRYHMPEEQRAQTYLALIHGASGLLYFVYPGMHESMWREMQVLGAELKTLSPIMLAGHIPAVVSYDPQSRLPDIHATMRQHAPGAYVIVAANSRPYPVAVEYTVEGLTENGMVGNLFDAATYPLQNGGFKDVIESCGRRAYTFELERKPSTEMPLRLNLKMIPQKDGYVAEQVWPREGRPGRKNILPNPGFEECSLPDWPDYWFGSGWQWWLAGADSSVRRSIQPDERVGGANAVYELDAESPYEGEYALRIKPGWLVSGWIAPQHDRPTKYVLSMYMRTDQDDMPARVSFSGGAATRKTFNLGREWRRYHMPVTISANASQYTAIHIGVQSGESDGNVWVDAMQFELGNEPTEYEP